VIIICQLHGFAKNLDTLGYGVSMNSLEFGQLFWPLSSLEIAEFIGCSKKAVDKYRSGERPVPKHIDKLVTRLSVRVHIRNATVIREKSGAGNGFKEIQLKKIVIKRLIKMIQEESPEAERAKKLLPLLGSKVDI
jgi:predicted transcriptional regulator